MSNTWKTDYESSRLRGRCQTCLLVGQVGNKDEAGRIQGFTRLNNTGDLPVETIKISSAPGQARCPLEPPLRGRRQVQECRKHDRITANSVYHYCHDTQLLANDFTDLIKADTTHLGPRYQLMLSQLAFKLSVEKQYKDGIEKVVRLYDIDGDKKSRAEAEGRRIECNQKIQLLSTALRRYEDLNVGIAGPDEPDGRL